MRPKGVYRRVGVRGGYLGGAYGADIDATIAQPGGCSRASDRSRRA